MHMVAQAGPFLAPCLSFPTLGAWDPGLGNPSEPMQTCHALGLISVGPGPGLAVQLLRQATPPPRPPPQGAQNRFLFGLQPQLAGGGLGGQQGRGRPTALAFALRPAAKTLTLPARGSSPCHCPHRHPTIEPPPAPCRGYRGLRLS